MTCPRSRAEHKCKPPTSAEDFTRWQCPKCSRWWVANEDDGWTDWASVLPPAVGDDA